MDTKERRLPEDSGERDSVPAQEAAELEENELDEDDWEESEEKEDDWDDLDSELDLEADEDDDEEWEAWDEDDPADRRKRRTPDWD